jgi:hypothetical protein
LTADNTPVLNRDEGSTNPRERHLLVIPAGKP